MPIDKQKMKRDLPKGVEFECIIFEEYMKPYGYLDANKETHALFWYYLNARKAYDKHIDRMEVILEGDKDPVVNFRQLFESIAFQYGANVETMALGWPMVDAQCELLGFPKMPLGYQFRFQNILH